jgi:hypothetical protein
MPAKAPARVARGQQHPAIKAGTKAAAAKEKEAVTTFKIPFDFCAAK